MKLVPFYDEEALKQHAGNARVRLPGRILNAQQIVIEAHDPNDTPTAKMLAFGRQEAPTATVHFADQRAVFAVWLYLNQT